MRLLVHAFHLRGEVCPIAVNGLAAYLHPNVRSRIARFSYRERRQQSVIGRILVGLLLSELGPSDGSLSPIDDFRDGAPGSILGHGVSISHGGDYVLAAAARGCSVGVDVEPDDLTSRLRIARLFAPAEQSAIFASSAPGLQLARLWTRKEAVAKASGYGLDELLSVQLDSDGVFLGHKKWHTAHLTQLPGHAVAVASNLKIDGACFRALTLDELVAKASNTLRES